MSVEVKIEMGHRAVMRDKATEEGFTHDWTVFVRGAEGNSIDCFVEKVVFHLHESFPKPKRVLKEPPYSVSESGYAGFIMPIDVYFRTKEEPKKVTFKYDLYLRLQASPVCNIRIEKLTFQNPSDDFRNKLLKAGGFTGALSGTAAGASLSTQACAPPPHPPPIDEHLINPPKPVVPEKKPKPHVPSKEIKSNQPTPPKPSQPFTDIFGAPIRTKNSPDPSAVKSKRFDYCTNMAFSAKNETNPAVIDATGYAPYIKARAERADALGSKGKKAFHQAQVIRDYWQREGAVNELSEYARNHRVDLFRNQWECEADKKALYSRVRWEMDKITAEMEKDLEKRRSRLADLLQSEESAYLDQMGVVEEDPEDKKERMLSRYAELTTMRESEREKVAQEKKEQQFRRNCEELRTLVSQKITRETAEEGRKILKEKEHEALERNREETLYAELWDRDRLSKELKEAREAEVKKKKGAENGQFVKDQILKNKLEKQKKLREKEQDLAVMEERKRLEALEEDYEKELKKRKQVELKTGLDECVREKMKRRAKEVQDDLLEDLFFMKQIAESEEEAAKCEKKRALMHEQRQYLKYLEDQIKAEAEFEREVDRMYKDELECTWKQREEEWEREKKKRRQREKDVCSEVQEQIRSNMEKCRKVQELNKLYCQKVMEEDAEDKRRNAERLRMIREKNVSNQKQLLDQMKRKEEELRDAKTKRDLELELLRLEREETEKKIQQLLSEVKIDNAHPYRAKAKELC